MYINGPTSLWLFNETKERIYIEYANIEYLLDKDLDLGVTSIINLPTK